MSFSLVIINVAHYLAAFKIYSCLDFFSATATPFCTADSMI